MRVQPMAFFASLFSAGIMLFTLGVHTLPNWAAPIPVPAMQPISPPIEHEDADENFARYTLNSGTALQVLLQTPINTGINQPGDSLEGILSQDIYLGNDKILSRNTRFMGVVSRLEKPIQGMDAILAVRFTGVTLDNGEELPLSAYVRTERPDHLWGGHVTPGTKPMVSVQRVNQIGSYNRIVYGGPRAMGKNIEFSPGERWTIILDQPLTILLPKSPEE